MKLAASLAATGLAIAVSSCGGSSSSSQTGTGSGTAPSTAQVKATLVGQDHHPIAGKPWHYTLTVNDAHGRPLSGIVDVEFTLGPLVVGHDRPFVHRLRNGVLKETLTFPARAVGHGISLQTVIHTRLGRVARRWPLTVRG